MVEMFTAGCLTSTASTTVIYRYSGLNAVDIREVTVEVWSTYMGLYSKLFAEVFRQKRDDTVKYNIYMFM
jgi:hypothetical protein